MTVDAAALPRPIAARYDRLFYTGMAIAASVIVFVGFAPTYFLRGSYQTTPLPTYLQVHGALFTAWLALFITQTSLVAVRRTGVHRRLGWVTAAVAAMMVVVGTTAGIFSMRTQVEAGNVQAAQAFLTTPLFSMTAFALFVAAAIARRRDVQAHKRLMLLATISILDAAVARLPFDVFRTSSWAYLPATDMLLAVAILYDLGSRRAVHPVYLSGGLLLVVEQALRIPVGETAVWQAIAGAILGSA
jgi:hypothetical protein